MRRWLRRKETEMEEKLRAVIAAHNRMIETIEGAEMTCNLFRGMEVWHKIACEGAEIVSAARSVGIGAKVDMQSGKISVQERRLTMLSDIDLSLNEIVSSLEDQALDKEDFVDEDDPDCIFRRDVATLRAVARLLRKIEVRNESV